MMLGHGHHELRTGPTEQVGPVLWVELVGGELGDEVLVAEGRVRPVGRRVMRELRRVLDVHVSRIPLVAEGGHRVHAPVDEYAELPVLIPGRHAGSLQRLPGRGEGAGGDDLLDRAKDLRFLHLFSP